jgi:glucose-6-phosphate isomerase
MPNSASPTTLLYPKYRVPLPSKENFMTHIEFYLGPLQNAFSLTSARLASEGIIPRLWNNDHTIWRSEEIHERSIKNRLGWLRSIELMKVNIDLPISFAEEIRAAGFTHAVVLGMGGSSLCPDVCRATFGRAEGHPSLLVLDSTHPASVARIENTIALETTLFIVASKSGGTTETNMFYKYFYGRVASIKGDRAGENFIAVTDADTQMELIAKEKKFRKIFINPTDIGGRYSALSFFGIVPMALMGMDIRKILESASEMMTLCMKPELDHNPGALLGIILGEAHRAGRDKLTLIASPSIATFGYWAEQLVAESTGKEGRGIVPVEGEALAQALTISPERRLVVFSTLRAERWKFEEHRKALKAAGRPFVEIILDDVYDLGAEFFRWEFATAVVAVLMKINPFDEPNVKESKDNTAAMIAEFNEKGKLPEQQPVAADGNVRLFCEPEYAAALKVSMPQASVKDLLIAHLKGVKENFYVALLAYIDQDKKNEELMSSLRQHVCAKARVPVTSGFGPRYLHSTGQLHKGGDTNGIFIELTSSSTVDMPIPGESFSFEVLKNAQALGDYRSLARHRRPLIRLHIDGDLAQGIQQIAGYLSREKIWKRPNNTDE